MVIGVVVVGVGWVDCYVDCVLGVVGVCGFVGVELVDYGL